MIIIRISGGLGNQMFQYATGRALALRNKTELFLDTHFFEANNRNTPRKYTLGKFNIVEKIADETDFRAVGIPNPASRSFTASLGRKLFRLKEALSPFSKKKFIIQIYNGFLPKILEASDNCYLSGNWQSEKYFIQSSEIIRKELSLKVELSSDAKAILQTIKNGPSVSVHVRRGDYAQSQLTYKKHGLCSPEYYRNAVNYISQINNNLNFFLFSDDPEWAETNLRFPGPTFIVSKLNLMDYEELILMSQCDHNIIANSSFSWWAAWLNSSPKKVVIAPKQWLNPSLKVSANDLIPEEWITL